MNAAVPVLFPAPSVTPHLHPRAVAARYDRRTRRVRVTLNLGTEVSVPAALIQGLSGALADDLGRIDITPLGMSLFWPTLEVQVSVTRLVEGTFGNAQWMEKIRPHLCQRRVRNLIDFDVEGSIDNTEAIAEYLAQVFRERDDRFATQAISRVQAAMGLKSAMSIKSANDD